MTKIAVIATGGKQYKVAQGDTITIEKLDAKEGDTVQFTTLLVSDDASSIEIGTPEVSSQVQGKVIAQTKDKKIEVIKFKSKSRYKRKLGHQQKKTKVEITKV